MAVCLVALAALIWQQNSTSGDGLSDKSFRVFGTTFNSLLDLSDRPNNKYSEEAAEGKG